MKADPEKVAFKNRVHKWAEKLEVKVVWLGIRPMQNKWASCSTAGHLNFNNELLHLDPALWDYVIVHELLHFFVPNHGKLWKSLMRAHLGKYEEFESRLRTPTLRIDTRNKKPR
ncbi:MAG: M48 family metallopeptidase [Verrucomicrobia bacterium]|nr:M48 family metallopeptidase [Verrucomicrobiota bacterium]